MFGEDRITQKMQDLVEKLNEATKAYDEGHPIMTDKEWDDLYFELINTERIAGFSLDNSPTQKIIYSVVNKLEKVTHSHKMLSLDKTKNLSEVESFLGDNLFIAMCKMDGLTCSLHYENGFLVSAETRGNGIIGENILHNAKVIPSIPKYISYTKSLTVDGEIICTYKKFKQFEQIYKNPRNFAAGSIRLLDSKECEARNLKFVAWDVIEGLDNHISHFSKDAKTNIITIDERKWFEGKPNLYLSNKLMDLTKLGFSIVPWYSTRFDLSQVQMDMPEIIEFLKKEAETASYPIDGIVFKIDNIADGKEMGETAHHFKNAIAYKFYDEVYETTLKYIDWTMGRTGVLTPVAVFEPIDIDGATIERASLHNYDIMREILGPCAYVGEPLKVFRANQIIPQLKPVEEEVRFNYGQVIARGGKPANDEIQICPICGGSCSVQESKDGVHNVVCDNPECQGKIINRLNHFVGKKGLDIKGLSKATFEKLIDWGYINNLIDVFNLYKFEKEWSKQEGFGEKSVKKILSAIEDAKNCTLAAFISALGIPLIGPAVAKDIANLVSSYEEFRELINMQYDFSQLSNFGITKRDALLDFDYSEADEIIKYLNIIKNNSIINNENEQKLQNKIFVITGKLISYKNRDELKAEIERNGGKVTSAVSAKTDFLINNDINSTSSKNIAAKKLNIPIITEEEFKAMLI